ncbi:MULTISPECIES: hypothetical protein [unclassified Pseudomonas]|uniref:hypothetical protein n=1 Tax=unclassified Pseudomonas TaxID=196821 RepID=UPI0030DA91F2
MDRMIRILLALAMGGATPARHMLIFAPEAAISAYPACHGLDAGSLWDSYITTFSSGMTSSLAVLMAGLCLNWWI